MTPMTPELFERNYHHMRVRIRGQRFPALAGLEGGVTAALYQEYDDKTTILAVMADDYTPENPRWFTIEIPEADFDVCMEDIELI